MSATRSRIPAFARWSALPVGLVVSAALVWQASYAAFTATTSTPTNNWSTGSVTLTDNDSGAALFTATNLGGGTTGSRCITVTYGGSVVPANVRLYGAAFTQTNSVATFINMQVQEVSAGYTNNAPNANGVGTCTATSTAALFSNTMANFSTSHSNYGNGLGTWAPAATNETRHYRIVYTVDPSITNTQQNSNAQLAFTWEATA